MPETASKREPVNKTLKLEALRKREAAIKQQIANIEAKEKNQARKDETREKVLVGAAILANIKLHPETRAGVVAVLEKGVVAPRDREFLKSKGWL